MDFHWVSLHWTKATPTSLLKIIPSLSLGPAEMAESQILLNFLEASGLIEGVYEDLIKGP